MSPPDEDKEPVNLFDQMYFFPLDQMTGENIKACHKWYEDARDSQGIVDRADINPGRLGHLVDYVSLFELIATEGAFTDFQMRIVSNEAASIFGEYSRRLGSETLPTDVFKGWLSVATASCQKGTPFLLRTRVQMKYGVNKSTEALIIPVKKDGEANQIMLINEYFPYDWDLYNAPGGRSFS